MLLGSTSVEGKGVGKVKEGRGGEGEEKKGKKKAWVEGEFGDAGAMKA